jgi:hypothetical protein
MSMAINADSTQTGGALTYLQNVVPSLARRVTAARDGRILVWASKRLPPLVRPVLYFGYRYGLRGGFLDGRAGASPT